MGVGSRAIQIWLLVGLLALAAAMGLQKIRSLDYWWHLRTGALIAETGSVPKIDVFTYTVPGNRYVDIHWGYQLGLHGIYQLGGHAGVVVAKAVFIAGLVVVLLPIGLRRSRVVVSVLALALMLVAASNRFMPRPELPSFVCLAGVLALLDRHDRRGGAWVWAIVPIQMLWANLHGLFAVGLVVCGIAVCAEFVSPLLRPNTSVRWPHVRRLAMVLIASAVASLANPNGLDGALYPLRQLAMIGSMGGSVFGSVITELSPPALAAQHGTGALRIATLVLGLLALLAMLLNWRQTPVSHPLLFLAFASLGLLAVRNIALFAIVAAPIVVRNLNEFLDRHPPRARSMALVNVVVALGISTLAADVARGSFFGRLGILREPGLGFVEVMHPTGAVDWIARERPPGLICSHMADGGYLIWRLYPYYRVMLDGRLEIFGEERFAELLVDGFEKFEELDEEYRFGSVLVHYGLVSSQSLLEGLQARSDMRLVYVDDISALYVRIGVDGSPQWPEIDPTSDLFSAVPLEPGLAGQLRAVSQMAWYTIMGSHERALEVWQHALQLYPDIGSGLEIQSALLARTGRQAEADRVLSQLLEDRGEDPALLAEIADVRAWLGDREGAKDFYDRALDLDSGFHYAAYQRGVLAEQDEDFGLAIRLYVRIVATAPRNDPIAVLANQRLKASGP